MDENPFAPGGAADQFSSDENPFAPGGAADQSSSSALGSFARGAAEGAAPGIGGVLAGIGVGGALGTELGPPGMIIGGIAGGIAGGAAISKAQQWLVDKLGLRNEAQEAADQEQHPWAREAGEMLPAALTLHPSGSAMQRVIGAGIGAVGGAASDLINNGKIDPASIAMGAGMGAAFPGVNNLGKVAERAGARLGARVAGKPAPVEPTAAPTSGQPENPEPLQGYDVASPDPVRQMQGSLPLQGDTGETPLSAKAQFIQDQRDKYQPGHPFFNNWDELLTTQLAQDRGWAAPGDDRDARGGPQGAQFEFTANDATRGSAAPIVNSLGNAVAQGPVTEVPNAGTPVGAPMKERIAADPNDPDRNYLKDKPTSNTPGSDSVSMTSGQTAPEIGAALAVDRPTTSFAQQGIRTPQEAPASIPPFLQRNPDGRPAPTPVTSAPEPARQPAPAPAPAPEPQAPIETGLTAAVTPEEQAGIDAIRNRLRGRPDLEGAREIFEGLPSTQQAKLAPEFWNKLNELENEENGIQANGRAKRVTKPGVTYNKEADRFRKEGSPAAVQKAVGELDDNHGLTTDRTPENKAKIREHAEDLFQRGSELYGQYLHENVPENGDGTPRFYEAARDKDGSVDPYSDVKKGKLLVGYQPNEKTPEHNIFGLARRIALNPKASWKVLEEYVKALELKGQTGKNVEGDVAMNARGLENFANEEGELPFAAPKERQEFNPIVPENEGHNVQPYNELVGWLNSRTPEEHDVLSDQYDLNAELAQASQPEGDAGALKDDMMNTLSAAKMRRQTPYTSTPVRTREEALAREDFISPKIEQTGRFDPTEVGKGVNGKVLDRNSPEFKAIADRLGAGIAPEAIPTKWDGATKAIASFVGDESGAGIIPQGIKDWFEPRPYDPRSPHRSDQVKQVLEYMPKWFKAAANQRAQDKGQLAANAVKAKATGLTTAADGPNNEWAQVHSAVQKQVEGALPAKLLDAWKSTGKPLLQRGNDLYQSLYDRRDEDPRLADLPAPHPGFDNIFFPRQKLDQPNADPWNVNPITSRGNSLSLYSPALMAREFTALRNRQTGDSLILRTNPDNGKFSLWKNLASRPVPKIPDGFTGAIGDVLKLNGKDYVVDHASTDEITQHNGTKFQENPIILLSNWVNQLEQVHSNLDMLQRIKTDPFYLNNTTTDKKVAEERGYDIKQTNLPPLQERGGKTIYMPRNMRWMFDDAYRQGFGGDDADWWRTTGSGLARIFMTFGSPIHVANIATNAIIARGFDNITPKGIRALGITGLRAWKAVMDPANSQDYNDFLKAGGRPQYLSAITNDLGNKVARLMGSHISTHPAIWDPIARIWGISTADLARAVEDFSTQHMWQFSDFFALQRFLENRNFKGMTPEAAAEDVHKFIPAYDLPSTVGTNGPVGRFIAQALADPAVSLFGRYHMDLLRSFAHVSRNAFGYAPGRTLTDAQRIKGIGQALTAAGLAYLVYPALDKLVQTVSGNPDAEMNRRGMLAATDAAQKLAEGDSDYQRLASNLFTPSIPLGMAMRVLGNQTWNRKNIIQPQPFTPAGIARTIGEAGEWGAQNAIAPYGNIATALEKPNADLLTAGGHFAAGMVGAHLPSDKERIFKANQAKETQRGINARVKNPAGPIERFGNYVAQGFAEGGQVQGGGKSPHPQAITAAVIRGTQLAMRRPIVTTPMPSGANSSKNLNGPVYVDPRVPPALRRPVAVHETVEQILMGMGFPYLYAHQIATQAEKQAVQRAGMNWEQYSHVWDGILPDIEHQQPGRLPPDLHVDPQEAIGHYRRPGGGHAVQEARAG